jgi:hypothetical protein
MNFRLRPWGISSCHYWSMGYDFNSRFHTPQSENTLCSTLFDNLDNDIHWGHA